MISTLELLAFISYVLAIPTRMDRRTIQTVSLSPDIAFDSLHVSLGKVSQHMNSGFRELAPGRKLRPRFDRYANDLKEEDLNRRATRGKMNVPGRPKRA